MAKKKAARQKKQARPDIHEATIREVESTRKEQKAMMWQAMHEETMARLGKPLYYTTFKEILELAVLAESFTALMEHRLIKALSESSKKKTAAGTAAVR